VKRVHDPYAKARHLAWRVVQTQLVAGALLAAVAMLASMTVATAIASVWGAASVAVAHGVFAALQMRGVAGVDTLLRRFYGAAAWKWLVLFALFALGLIGLRLPAGGLLSGLIAAQLAGTWALVRYG